ncbi:ataxin-2 homolog [Melanaphis sacchari]|uniref:ataxin-2 homolog n=1 Tax=Melanaphis sacchari TaxID=742174 RepID=UPI000DC138B7|nr:ataxin-2 homolog [Melanaphis sacchari]
MVYLVYRRTVINSIRSTTMDSARSARHLLAVAIITVAIALCYAAAVGGGTGPSPGNAAAFAPSSILNKLPQSQLPKFPVIYTYGKSRTTQTPVSNYPTLLGGKHQQPQQSAPQPQRPSQQQQQQPQKTPQQTSQPQKRPSKPTSTTDERPGGRVPNQLPVANASVTTTSKPKLETTTQVRSIITAPQKTCPEGQRMSPDRNCRPDFTDPEDDQSK